jgi:hypothetical protein
MEHCSQECAYICYKEGLQTLLQFEESHLLGCDIESKDRFGLIFLHRLTLKIKALRSPETSATTYPVTQHNRPEGSYDSD